MVQSNGRSAVGSASISVPTGRTADRAASRAQAAETFLVSLPGALASVPTECAAMEPPDSRQNAEGSAAATAAAKGARPSGAPNVPTCSKTPATVASAARFAPLLSLVAGRTPARFQTVGFPLRPHRTRVFDAKLRDVF